MEATSEDSEKRDLEGIVYPLVLQCCELQVFTCLGEMPGLFPAKKGNSSLHWVFYFRFSEESRCIKSVSKREVPQGLNSSVESR